MWIEPVRDWNKYPPDTKTKFAGGVNWTCEGLKHYKLRDPISNFNLVWIEPVRDWNRTPLDVARMSQEGCELNLWGIETQILNLFRSNFN